MPALPRLRPVCGLPAPLILRCSSAIPQGARLRDSVRRCACESACNRCLPSRLRSARRRHCRLQRRSAARISAELRIAEGFLRGGQDRFGFGARFDHLALGEILLGVFDRFFEHALDFGVVEAVAGLHFDGVLLAGAQIFRGDLQDAVGVDQEFYFDARQACGRGRNFQSESARASGNPWRVRARLAGRECRCRSDCRRRWCTSPARWREWWSCAG